jgi:hypothetical protein
MSNKKTKTNNLPTVTPLTIKSKRLQVLHKLGIIPTPTYNQRTVQIMTITPQMAMEMLQCNVINRPMRSGWANEITHIMNRGKFQLTNDAICFDMDGHLTNAQHRLLGVVQSGVSCEFIVAFGIEFSPDMDGGLKRSLLDNIKKYGYGLHVDLHNSRVISVAQNCCRYMSKTSHCSNDEVIEFMKHYEQELLDCLDIITSQYGSTWHRTAVFMMYIGQPDLSVKYSGGTPIKPTLNECKEFYSVYISDSSTAPKHNPIRAIHVATGELFASGFGGADAHKREIISIVQDAMNQFISGTCSNALEKYTSTNMYKYDMSFLNIDINGCVMDQQKYKV